MFTGRGFDMGNLPIIGTVLGTIAALTIVAGAVYLLHDRLDHGRRPRVFVATFIAVALICFAKQLLFETDAAGASLLSSFATSATAALTSLGMAGAAFLGGNGFALFPDAAGDAAGLAWIAANPGHFALHALFELGNLLSLALTAEFALTLFTGFSTHLSLTQGHFGDVLIVHASEPMAVHAERFINGASESATSTPPAIIFRLSGDDPSHATWRISAAGHTEATDRERALQELASIARHLGKAPGKTQKRRRERSIYIAVFRNGRVTVALYHPDRASSWRNEDWERALDGAEPASDAPSHPSGIDNPSDLYSYSVEEIRVRQLVRQLLPPQGADIGIGTRPLTAMVMGNDVERMVLTIVYLVRNGQALLVGDDLTAQPRQPRIVIASAKAGRIERRLRRAYPALFPDDLDTTTISGKSAEQQARLTPPATLAFFSSKLDMIEQTPLDADGVTLVINTEPDEGRAPSQREVWHRALERRCPAIRPVYVQFDESEHPGFVWENSYGGRERAHAEDLKRVLIYGSTADCMQSSLVLHRSIDRRAMMVNLRYADSSAKPDLFDDAANEPYLSRAQSAWDDPALTLYDRESSRATADFIGAERLFWNEQAHALAARDGRSALTDEDRAVLRDLVGQLEHLRWNAYMVTSGYITRPWGDLAQDFAASWRGYLHEGGDANDGGAVKSLVKSAIRDKHLKRHVALVDWEFLPLADKAIASIADTPENERVLSQAGVLTWVRSRCNQQSDLDIADQFITVD